MAAKKLDAFLVTDRMDQIYLTGFTGEDGAVLITSRTLAIVTDGRFTEAVATEAPWARAVMWNDPLAVRLAKVVKQARAGRVGIEPVSMNVGLHAAVRKAIRPAKLVSAPGLLGKLRILKDTDEVAATRRAIDVAEAAFATTLRGVRIGLTERELAARLEFEMKKRGASAASFDIIVAEGPNASKPHAHPGDRKLKSGSAVLCDWGAVVDHYRSDLTRVFFVDRVPPKFRRIYPIVLEAQLRGIEAIRPGVRMCDVDAAARRHIKMAGFGKQFSHGLGHGLGLDIHEAPRLTRKFTDKLEAGMLVTVEPGIYLPGVGGVRIEDDVLVTQRGHEVLSGAAKSLDDMILPGR